MSQRMILWSVLFAAGLLTVVFHMELSWYLFDMTTLLVGGSVLAATAGTGMLLELCSLICRDFRKGARMP